MAGEGQFCSHIIGGSSAEVPGVKGGRGRFAGRRGRSGIQLGDHSVPTEKYISLGEGNVTETMLASHLGHVPGRWKATGQSPRKQEW